MNGGQTKERISHNKCCFFYNGIQQQNVYLWHNSMGITCSKELKDFYKIVKKKRKV